MVLELTHVPEIKSTGPMESHSVGWTEVNQDTHAAKFTWLPHAAAQPGELFLVSLKMPRMDSCRCCTANCGNWLLGSWPGSVLAKRWMRPHWCTKQHAARARWKPSTCHAQFTPRNVAGLVGLFMM